MRHVEYFTRCGKDVEVVLLERLGYSGAEASCTAAGDEDCLVGRGNDVGSIRTKRRGKEAVSTMGPHVAPTKTKMADDERQERQERQER